MAARQGVRARGRRGNLDSAQAYFTSLSGQLWYLPDFRKMFSPSKRG
jgi:hypothetical protein